MCGTDLRIANNMFSIFLLLLYGEMLWNRGAGGAGYGYDSGGEQGACGRPYRTGRVYQPLPPCDLAKYGYCTSAGPAYPWTAVKRFVRENHGLMRRMYGDQKHDAVLRAELNNLDEEPPRPSPSYQHNKRYARYGKEEKFHFDIDHDLDLELGLDMGLEDNELSSSNEDRYHHGKTEGRYLKEDVLNTKFVYSEEPSITIRLKDISSVPYFRPTSQRTTTMKITTQSATSEIPSEATTTGASTTSSTSTTGSSVDYEAHDRTSPDVTSETTTEPTVTTTTNFDSTTRTTTPTVVVADDRLSSDNNDTDGDNELKNPPNTMLFQDMVEEEPKPQPSFHMRGVNACPVKEEVVAPFWANNTRGEVLALLNMYPFEQYVHWEKCTHEFRQMYCREGCRCEQQYRLHRLLAYDPDNECRGIFSDWFRFPSCCVCKCYGLPQEFRVTSRSPRRAQQERNEWPP